MSLCRFMRIIFRKFEFFSYKNSVTVRLMFYLYNFRTQERSFSFSILFIREILLKSMEVSKKMPKEKFFEGILL